MAKVTVCHCLHAGRFLASWHKDGVLSLLRDCDHVVLVLYLRSPSCILSGLIRFASYWTWFFAGFFMGLSTHCLDLLSAHWSWHSVLDFVGLAL